MLSRLQRKYTDLIYNVSSQWVNWDPLIEMRVGTYGIIDKETGSLQVEGNIYDPEFQRELDKHGVDMDMADFPPQEGPIESDFIATSRGATRTDLSVDKQIDGTDIAHAAVKGQWRFKDGMRGAVLIMHNPRQIILPPDAVLEPLYRVDKLVDKCLVTSIHVCPAYSMYITDECHCLGNKVSLALVPQGVITGDVISNFSWWADAPTGTLRKGCDTTGKYLYTPIFALKRPIGRIRKTCRYDEFEVEPFGDDLWSIPYPPWDPLCDDGEEDLIDLSMKDTLLVDGLVAI